MTGRARILLVNQYFPPDASATAFLLGELSEGLSKDHAVHVLAGRASYNPEAGGNVPNGPFVRRVPSTTFSRSTMSGRLANYLTFSVGAAVKAISAPRADVVMAFTDPPIIGVVGLLAATRHKSSFVYVCMDVFPDVAQALGRVSHPAAVRAWRMLNHLLRRRADRIVVVGRDMREKLVREGVPAEKIVFIPNWATGTDRTPRTPTELRTEAQWMNKIVVMHAGNVGLAQDLGTVIDAAEHLRARGEVHFVFLGDGAARPALEQRVTALGLTNVEFIPQRRKDEAHDLIAQADVQLVSLAQGLAGCAVPSKVYGILAQGQPFVAAVEPNSEVDRIARESGAGSSVPPGDARALADEIVTLVEAARDREQMGKRARAEFETKYRSELAVARYAQVVRSVLQVSDIGDLA